MPHSLANELMTVQWWQEQEELLLQKVVQHERDVRHAASASQIQEQIQTKPDARILEKGFGVEGRTAYFNGKECRK